MSDDTKATLVERLRNVDGPCEHRAAKSCGHCNLLRADALVEEAADEIERLTKINRDSVESHNYYLVKCSNLERRLELIKRYADERHADDHRMDTDTVLNDFFEATDDEIATQLYRSLCADGK